VKLVAIVSGGQTGADRGGLDAAISLGLNHGGYVPAGRGAEDGRVPDCYEMIECSSSKYPDRTRLNVELGQATVIFYRGEMSRGSMLTLGIADHLGKPLMTVNLECSVSTMLREFLDVTNVEVLNVAGTRESRAPGIQKQVRDFIVEALR